jgi:3-hydroxyacyl-CoA dehydrogenase/enoyl-CoA hydratase/3-hydroxybutyryl-CoA epimerase/enoyl-CoA isomerase
MIYEGKAITVKLLEDGIAELNFDLQGESVNKFNRLTLEDLNAAVQSLQGKDEVKGLVVTSSKDCFIVGADITEFGDMFKASEEEITAGIAESNQVFNAFEDLPFPTVTAINGIALGGGFEMCLASDFRIMSEKAKVGLPEVKLGLFPGFGGTVRLPRVIGADNAIEWICMGAESRADKALKFGAVDAVVKAEVLKDQAIEMVKAAIAGSLDWKAKREEKLVKLKLEAMEQMMVFETAKGFVAGQTKGQYPAPVLAIKTMQKAANFGRDKALEVEAKGFAKLAKTTESQALIGLFNNDQLLKKKSQRI